MSWDGLLLAVFAYNVRCSERRGARTVGIALAAFALTYSATLWLAPLLTHWVRANVGYPPPFLSLLSVLLVFFSTRRVLRLVFQPFEPREEVDRWFFVGPSPRSRLLGMGLGGLRGAIVVTAMALFGCNLAILQQAGLMQTIPPARDSLAIRSAGGFVDALVDRYTRDAGPTTLQLVDLTLHPAQEKTEALLAGPFVDRLKRSDEVKDLVRNQEFRQLAQQRRTTAMITHPAFLRVLSLTIQELRAEKAASTQTVLSLNSTGV